MGGLYFGWLAVLPFYLLEILVGLVQALVFALLCAVFTALMCEKHDDHALNNFDAGPWAIRGGVGNN